MPDLVHGSFAFNLHQRQHRVPEGEPIPSFGPISMLLQNLQAIRQTLVTAIQTAGKQISLHSNGAFAAAKPAEGASIALRCLKALQHARVGTVECHLDRLVLHPEHAKRTTGFHTQNVPRRGRGDSLPCEKLYRVSLALEAGKHVAIGAGQALAGGNPARHVFSLPRRAFELKKVDSWIESTVFERLLA